MNKLKDRIVQIIWQYPDKVGHFMGGYILAQLMFFIPYLSIYSIIPIVFIIALFNELIDEIIKQSFSWVDLWTTVIGGVNSFIVMLLYDFIHNIPIE
jgi:hypothetical protein